MRLKVAHGTVVSSHGTLQADVVCSDGKVEALAEPGRGGPADETVDAHGQLVFPGFIDPHVHSRDPGLTQKEDFAHSTRAAAAGGVMTICEMPNAIPPVTDAATYAARAAHHGEVAFVDFALWGLALGTQNLAEIRGLFEAGAIGVKLFWGYALNRRTKQLVYNLADEPPENLIPPATTGEVLELCRAVAAANGLLAAHCEDRALIEAAQRALGHDVESYADLLAARPDTAEAASIAVAAELSWATGCRFHVVHMASRRGTGVVRRAQADGAPITAETCPQYLTLTDQDFATLGPLMKVYPPIRYVADQEALWQGLRDGTITCVSSDHAPHTVEEKRQGLATQPAGFAGVETIAPLMVSAMLAGRIAPEQLAWVLAEGTARLFGLAAKGVIRPGADADLVIVDPEGETVLENVRLHSKQPLTPWHGRRLKGALTAGILRGQVVMRDGEPIGEPRGRLVRRRAA